MEYTKKSKLLNSKESNQNARGGSHYCDFCQLESMKVLKKWSLEESKLQAIGNSSCRSAKHMRMLFVMGEWGEA